MYHGHQQLVLSRLEGGTICKGQRRWRAASEDHLQMLAVALAARVGGWQLPTEVGSVFRSSQTQGRYVPPRVPPMCRL